MRTSPPLSPKSCSQSCAWLNHEHRYRPELNGLDEGGISRPKLPPIQPGLDSVSTLRNNSHSSSTEKKSVIYPLFPKGMLLHLEEKTFSPN